MIHLSRYPDYERLNPALLMAINLHRSLDPTSKLGMGTGWSGQKDFFTHKVAAPLVEFIQSKIPERCSLVGWANYLLPGDSIGIHNHGPTGFSNDEGAYNNYAGVYYLTPASLGINHPMAYRGQIESIGGDLVIFPANVDHYVTPTKTIRVSIAFNAHIIE